MPAPLMLVVDDRERERATLLDALTRRYGVDYTVDGVASPHAALELLEGFPEGADDVALVFAWQNLEEMDAAEFLVRVHDRRPRARRLLVISRGEWGSAHPAVRAMTLGQVDHYLYEPWVVEDRWLHPLVGEALSDWWRERTSELHAVEVVGTPWDTASHEMRTLFARIGVPYGFVDVDSDQGRELLESAGLDASRLPVLLFARSVVLVDPTIRELGAALGFATEPADGLCDVAILGAGPAGLSAAVYAASEGLRTTIVDAGLPGGQASTSSLIRNYLGFPHGLAGDELANRAVEQAWLFGADFVVARRAVGLYVDNGERHVRLDDGGQIRARAVVLATGVEWRRLDAPALEALQGVGVFYGAAGGEAKAIAGEDVFVVGGGNSAGQAAVHLAKYARSVTMLVRGESLAASMSDYLMQEIAEHPRIAVRHDTEVHDGAGAGRLQTLTLRDRRTGALEEVDAFALFVMIGAEPHTEWLPQAVQCDGSGYVVTGHDLLNGGKPPAGWPLTRPPLLLETSAPGVFAVGDVRHRSVKRVASAAGEGATAVQLVHQYLAELGS